MPVFSAADRCPSCDREYLARELEVTRENRVYLWYRCDLCRVSWTREITPELTVTLPGEGRRLPIGCLRRG